MKQRLITGVIAAALFLPIVWLGGLPFLLAVYFIASIGLFELLRMRGIPITSFSGTVALLVVWGLLLPDDILQQVSWVSEFDRFGWLYIGIIVLLGWTVVSKNRFSFVDAGFVTVSMLYVGIPLAYFYELRELGLAYLLLVMLTIWASDIGAYQVGRKIGKRKLWETISPNKTIEGFFGGVVAAVLVAACFYVFSDIAYPLWHFLLLGIVIASVGTFGDLVESAYKRHFHVKDSGAILPGHGGVLDRFDSLMYTLPVLFILQLIGN